ncbi:MAG TPA: PQQ-dependent sugar dehydrogenase [Gemmataceae bacterium]|nr:PQQ-dependent sugar dehydrogenase [Gemmataceae bacterium]
MKKRTAAALLTGALLSVFALLPPFRPATAEPPKAEPPHGIGKRVPWTTSHVTGSPEPPHPYKIERAFPKLQFKNPLLMARTGDRFFVGEHAGKIFSFPDDQSAAKADLFLDLTTELNWDKSRFKNIDAVYGLAFHPNFAKNRYCYVCYVLNSVHDGEQLPDGSRVSRFTVGDADPPRVDPKSEKVLITWLGGGHNGGDIHFGPDRFLYVSTGDGWFPNPPDKRDTGQDISDLLSSVLRIDVDHQDRGQAYAVPADNPFVKTPNARPEVWAYGFRNPWRMSFDRATGDLWVGDVGWELWEMVYRVKKGGNYGWSVMEGPQPIKPEGKRGPTPILPPNLAFPHTEAASITGGYVSRGKRLKDLEGAYVCGDWVTRKLWATKFDGDKVVWHKEIAQGTQRVVAFGEARDGELYFLDYDDPGRVYRLVPNPAAAQKQPDFPRKLSETGLFASVKEHTMAPGVVPFSVNAAQWADHATAERFLALPGTTTAKMYDSAVSIPGGFYSGTVFFPKDGVLAKTIVLEMERGKPASRRRLETQLLHFDGTVWHGYSYAWNDEQTDAILVPSGGADRPLTVSDAKAPGGKRQQTWHFPSRAECMTCHNPWSGQTLAFTLPQLERNHDYDGGRDNQVRALKHAGLIELLHNPEDEDSDHFHVPPPLTDPHDASAKIDARARSYLHVNCAHCHRFGAGGSVDLELKYDTPLDRMKILETRPVQGTFEMPGGQILAPGDPYRSALYYRMAKLGRGRMPHVGSEVVDEQGLRLIHDWIRQLPIRKDERSLVERLRDLDEPAVLAREKADWERNVKRTAQWLARTKGRDTATDEDRGEAEAQLKVRGAAGVKERAAERASTIDRLLSSTSSALLLADALGEARIPASVRVQVLAAALKLSDAQVRDLFERFVPDEQRVKRLGSVIKPAQLLSLKGSAERGRELFFKSTGLQCVNCHRVNGTGSTLGPDLSQIAKKATRAQILESLLEPSKNIEPQYVTYLLETTDGKVHTGLLGSKTDTEVVLKVVGDKEVRVPSAKVERLAPQPKSLMPELLLRDLTAEQAADLLEFLSGLK